MGQPRGKCVHLFNSWYPVQLGDSEKVWCQHSRQTKKKAIAPKEWPTKIYRGTPSLPMTWLGKLGTSFQDFGIFCRVKSRWIVGHGPLCAETLIIRLDIWLNRTITAMDSWCSPVPAGDLTPQDDSLASHAYSFAL